MSQNLVEYSVKNNLGFIQLVAAPKNEMNTLFFQEFNQIVQSIKNDLNIQGLIIQANGRHFSSGANTDELLSLFRQTEDLLPKEIEQNAIAFRELADMSIPVISCLKGICFGSALELALSSHFRIASPSTLMSFPEVGFGIIPGLAGIYRLEKIVGKAQAMKFTLSSESISAEEAKKYGLIDIFATKHELENQAVKLIDVIGNNYKKELKQSYLRRFIEP
jgi:enoyl-CoA hydratase/carnithine racemase